LIPFFLPFLFFTAPPTSFIHPLSLHDALPISHRPVIALPAKGVALLLEFGPSLRERLGLAAQVRPLLFRLLQPLVELCDLAHERDRKSTRLNSSHLVISYAVFCLKKKNNNNNR